MKRLVMPFAVVGLIILGVCGYFWYSGRSGTDTPVKEVDPVVEAATLAIKGISLFQGEKGFEFWRLKAEWAAMNQDKGIIDVKEPKVRYTLGEPADNDYVYATSELGRVSDEQTVLTMWDDVVLTRGNDRLSGPEMVYRTDERVVRFPRGGRMDRPSMHGLFSVLVWSMDDNTVEVSDGVDITFLAGDSPLAEDSLAEMPGAEAVGAESSGTIPSAVEGTDAGDRTDGETAPAPEESDPEQEPDREAVPDERDPASAQPAPGGTAETPLPEGSGHAQ